MYQFEIPEVEINRHFRIPAWEPWDLSTHMAPHVEKMMDRIRQDPQRNATYSFFSWAVKNGHIQIREYSHRLKAVAS